MSASGSRSSSMRRDDGLWNSSEPGQYLSGLRRKSELSALRSRWARAPEYGVSLRINRPDKNKMPGTRRRGRAMKGKRAVLLASAVMVCSCASTESMHASLGSAVGKPVNHVVSIFGAPKSQLKVGESTVYVWRSEYHYTVMQPTSQDVTMGPNGQTQVNMHSVPVDKFTYCQVELTVDDGGIVTGYRWEGNGDVCYQYSKLGK